VLLAISEAKWQETMFGEPVGAEYRVTPRDLGVSADEAVKPIPPENTRAGCLLATVDPGPGLGRISRVEVSLRSTLGIRRVHGRSTPVRAPVLPRPGASAAGRASGDGLAGIS
jgi:hypothetical protein